MRRIGRRARTNTLLTLGGCRRRRRRGARFSESSWLGATFGVVVSHPTFVQKLCWPRRICRVFIFNFVQQPFDAHDGRIKFVARVFFTARKYY
ncbi:hypothetical protein Mapa_001207 [Marchantia paleacea]|nr:hypothetical protein Mapa_001207 [Marchantia paleacea]